MSFQTRLSFSNGEFLKTFCYNSDTKIVAKVAKNAIKVVHVTSEMFWNHAICVWNILHFNFPSVSYELLWLVNESMSWTHEWTFQTCFVNWIKWFIKKNYLFTFTAWILVCFSQRSLMALENLENNTYCMEYFYKFGKDVHLHAVTGVETPLMRARW